MNSHGFADLAPTRLNQVERTLDVTLRVRGGRARRVRIAEGGRGEATIEILGPVAGPRLDR
jgi:hypothetical protein